MSYFVSFGGIVLHCVESVTETSGRDIEEHKSLAGEAFPTAGGANLREWTISCVLSNVNDFKDPNWKSADEIFRQFEICLKTKDYSRFIMTSSGKASVSELTWLERYSKKEKYDGVWEVEITLKEYRPVQIMTADVPTITRPGKNPNPPKTVGKNTAYGATKAATGKPPSFPKKVQEQLDSTLETLDKVVKIVDPKNNKPITNPCLAKPENNFLTEFVGPVVKPVWDAVTNKNPSENKKKMEESINEMKKAMRTPGQVWEDTQFVVEKGVGSAFTAMSDAVMDFRKKMGLE